TTDAGLEDGLRLLRVHGSRRRYEHETLGWNARMHELQAAVLRTKLPHLAAWTARRRALAAVYDQRLRGLDGVRPPALTPDHVFHQYVIRCARRDQLRRYLAERGIGTEVYYPIPLHQQPALRQFAPLAPLPEAERAAHDVLALPMFPELGEGEVEQVAAAVREFYS
ncbi:MAG: DegT/DnrJ/EryC1/StrS family aminotransferase, partial [Terriglobales bacterium]